MHRIQIIVIVFGHAVPQYPARPPCSFVIPQIHFQIATLVLLTALARVILKGRIALQFYIVGIGLVYEFFKDGPEPRSLVGFDVGL